MSVENNGWLPIESAPRDGALVLAWDGFDYTICYWYSHSGGGWSAGWETANGYDVGELTVYPAHWMPLPEPPQ